MRIAVVGRGLIGSAAARHLAKAGHEVVLIGPSEPEDKRTHKGVFASHYDEGRITRGLDPWPFWSRVSRASISRYGEIEAESGMRFYSEVGSLMAGPEGSAFVERMLAVRDRDSIACDALCGQTLAERFPFFDFPEGTFALHEPARAGYISPRRLVEAQGRAALRHGAQIVDAVVTGLEEKASGVRVMTPTGVIEAERVLVAAGGFANFVLPKAMDLKVFARTVVMLELPEVEAVRLAAMPSLIYLLPTGEDPYLLPPIRYPDGKVYIKMGGDVVDRHLPDMEAVGDWFRSGGDASVGEMLEGLVRDRIPGLHIQSRHTQACVTTYSPQNIPYLEMQSPRIGVAVAGCGRGAKCSDEIGRLGGEVVLGHDLPDWAREAAVV